MRINELRTDHADILTADRPHVIHALMDIGLTSKAMGTPVALQTAASAFLKAERLQHRMSEDSARDRETIERELGQLAARARRAGIVDEAPLPAVYQAWADDFDLDRGED